MSNHSPFGAAFGSGFDGGTITTPEQVTRWLGNPNIDPALITDAWKAAEAYVGERVMWDGTPPDSLVLAVDMQTARYLERRNSPSGIVGMGDLGPAQVPFSDIDVERAMNPHRFFPVA